MQRRIFRLGEARGETTVRLHHIVISHPDAEFTAQLHERFHQKGYSVHLARSGEQARFLTRRFLADLVVLQTDMLPESGWLTCHKLTREYPFSKVILVAPVPTSEDHRLARFVSASAIVDRFDGVDGILEQVDEIDLETRTA
jgi:CheY-like chemotaxis protein